MSAFAPSAGQSSAELGKDFPVPPGIATLAADAAATRLVGATQGPIRGSAFGEAVSVAAWQNKPNYYIVAANDRMIAPALQQSFAAKLNATTTVVQSSHVPMLSQPAAVARVILAAAAR